MATYSNHNTSGFATVHYGGCIWCTNITPIPWKMFEGAEYNHYFFDSQLIWAILVLYERTFLNNMIKLQQISNNFFFAKLGSKYHNILIFFLI
jgi:hypothetical protein